MTDGVDPVVKADVDARCAGVRAVLYAAAAVEQRALLAAGVDAGVVATALPLAGAHLLADLLIHFIPAATIDLMTGHIVTIVRTRIALAATTNGMTRQ